MDADFDPEFFAHGRLLWRFDGSDAVRFSPRLAWGMLSDAAKCSGGAGWLWDPFAGAGLVPALARLFFPSEFAGIAASDASLEAVETAAKNLALVSDTVAAEKRLAQVTGLRGQNPKSDRRWGNVAAYLSSLMPRIEAVSNKALPTRVDCALAHEHVALLIAPESTADANDLFIVGDAPYGKGSQLIGPPLGAVLQGWIDEPRIAYVDVVCTQDQARSLPQEPRACLRSARAGRARWTFARQR